jgi:TRAP-type C4-dicarboxylate transport system permease small subunit
MRPSLLDRLAGYIIVLGGVSLVILIAITGYQVWGRYVLNDTPTWAERLALLLILFVSLPVAAVGLRENFHLGITFVLDRLPRKLRRVVEMLNALILLGFGGAMAWFSWVLVRGTWNRDIPLLGIPQAFQYLPLVLCGVLIAIFMAARFYELLSTQ